MAIRFNFPSAATILVAMAIHSMVQAETIGGIKCGSDNSTGERVVCDYAIIGYKYQKLFDAQFSNRRNVDIETEVRKNIAACDGLHCVEEVIDKQMASPVAEQVITGLPPASISSPMEQSDSKSTANLPSNSGPHSSPLLNSNNTENATRNDENKGDGLGGSLVILLFIVGIVWLGFWLVSRVTHAFFPNKKDRKEISWFSILLAILASSTNESRSNAGKISAIIKPYGKSSSDGFEWDGKILKPYGRSSSDGWELDGEIFKPYGQSSSDGYEWDGRFLKPYGKSWSDGYEWDGRILRPYGRSSSDGYELDGLNMKPYGRSASDGWEATAAVPAPVWAIVLGLI